MGYSLGPWGSWGSKRCRFFFNILGIFDLSSKRSKNENEEDFFHKLLEISGKAKKIKVLFHNFPTTTIFKTTPPSPNILSNNRSGLRQNYKFDRGFREIEEFDTSHRGVTYRGIFGKGFNQEKLASGGRILEKGSFNLFHDSPAKFFIEKNYADSNFEI